MYTLDDFAIGDRFRSEAANVWEVTDINKRTGMIGVKRINGTWDKGFTWYWFVECFDGMVRLSPEE